jgi:uncharacterized DUF497 family protein
LADAPHIRFEWDDAKNDRCVRDRGFGFADILPAFLDPNRWVERDVRRDYGGATMAKNVSGSTAASPDGYL